MRRATLAWAEWQALSRRRATRAPQARPAERSAYRAAPPPAADNATGRELEPPADADLRVGARMGGGFGGFARNKAKAAASRGPAIVIKPWDPDTPYLKELRAAKGDLFALYMKQRAKYGDSPAFFLDCSDFFREAGNAELSLQVLSNIAELELDDATLLRVLAHRLEQIGRLDLAILSFDEVLSLRPEEPQSYRDLALALARRAQQAANDGSRPPSVIRQDYARAVDLLTRVVFGRWDARFPEIEVIALEELNRMIPWAKAAGVSDISLDGRLLKVLDMDIRIVMTWHADNTDIDLWVIEPSGEKAFYAHNRTTIGGLVSCDFTQGYGPEEYLVRRAAPGIYKIEANYYGSRATRLLGPVTVQVDVFTDYGRKNEQRQIAYPAPAGSPGNCWRRGDQVLISIHLPLDP